MTDDKDLWLAEVQTRNTRSRALGHTPEEALASLLRLWKQDWAPMSGADPDYLYEIRDEITIAQFNIGDAFLIAGTDALWHSELHSADEPRFDHIFQISPTPR